MSHYEAPWRGYVGPVEFQDVVRRRRMVRKYDRDRYAEPDKGHTDRSDEWWPVPYWDIDTGMAAPLILQSAVDAGLGACSFGLPIDRIPVYREQFGVPENFSPIGAVSIGYSDEPPRNLSKRRKPQSDLIHRGRWTS